MLFEDLPMVNVQPSTRSNRLVRLWMFAQLTCIFCHPGNRTMVPSRVRYCCFIPSDTMRIFKIYNHYVPHMS